MDRWDNMKVTEKNSYQEQRRQRRYNNPSFSSTLLDDIYRSIDGEGQEELILYTETMRKKRTTNCAAVNDDDTPSLQRACMIEKWIEKKVSEKVVFRRETVPPEFPKKSRSYRDWSSSSSDSSSGGCFSSSELESINGVSSSSSCFNPQRPKAIRTSVSQNQEKFNKQFLNDHQLFDKCSKPKHESGFVKTKCKAMKIYGDLKKAKQPISPGGRLATFLNSLFTAGTVKKAKISSSHAESAYTSACSSASSFSRSCLSKTPSSRGKLSNGAKRSVTFHPVSVIVGEDCQPCGQKSLGLTNTAGRNSVNDEIRLRIMEKHQHVEEVARDMLRNYQKKVEHGFNLKNAAEDYTEEIDKDDEEDDAASDASSDLFELDNLSVIGIERYREELPVYETTHLGTNRAIASGLIS